MFSTTISYRSSLVAFDHDPFPLPVGIFPPGTGDHEIDRVHATQVILASGLLGQKRQLKDRAKFSITRIP